VHEAVEIARRWLADAAAVDAERWTSWTAEIGGESVRFRCLDARVARRWSARIAQSVEAEGRKPDLRFDLVETRKLGWPDPGSAIDWERDPAAIDAALASAGVTVLAGEARGPRASFPWVVFDPAASHGLLLVRDLEDLPDWSGGAPFSLLFHVAAAWRGRRLLHAGSLGREGRGVLIMGDAGTGKSATTLAGVTRGMQTVGDDFLLVSLDPRPVAHPVYRLVKQDRAGLERLGGTAARLRGRPLNAQGKVELDPEEIAPGCRAPALGLAAILLPVRSRQPRSRIERMAPAEVFAALGKNTFMTLPGGRIAGFRFLARLTRALPAYRLALSREPDDIATCVSAVLDPVSAA
jgi:hypothetical protein